MKIIQPLLYWVNGAKSLLKAKLKLVVALDAKLVNLFVPKKVKFDNCEAAEFI